ncbi:hypothetical protein DY000_02003080 [Brassica cretica]|uniref:Uncharacterized protein n=1 Tax=Brassica cretica TaxID=69181 RepID=A0ABQ7CIU3_BRACR|nr:hypothetical protein DY000_02003080 [Brassica cretica]
MGVITPIESLLLKSQYRLLQPRDHSYPVVSHNTRRVTNFPHNSFSPFSLGSSSVDFPLRSDPISQNDRSSYPWRRYVSESDTNEVKYNQQDPGLFCFLGKYFVPGLGFMMFAVGINSNERDFLEALKRPDAIFAGYIGQYLIKPLLGYMFGVIAVSLFNLPTPIGAGIMLVSCVSGAQLSNYTTFLTDPSLAPLSIVMTSISTATAALVTPMLSLLLIGKKLPVDVIGMISSILQVVVTPIAAGLLLNRTLSYETGMQSSLLALALATKFFQDPLVGVPPAISTVVMSLMGVSLVTIWKNRKE